MGCSGAMNWGLYGMQWSHAYCRDQGMLFAHALGSAWCLQDDGVIMGLSWATLQSQCGPHSRAVLCDQCGAPAGRCFGMNVGPSRAVLWDPCGAQRGDALGSAWGPAEQCFGAIVVHRVGQCLGSGSRVLAGLTHWGCPMATNAPDDGSSRQGCSKAGFPRRGQ